jgi:hypothetical protein
MSAMLEIQKHRRTLERIDTVSMLRVAMNASKKDAETIMTKWARSAEVDIRFED